MITKQIISEVTRGHFTPNHGLFTVIFGQRQKIFKPGKITDQNEALGRVVTKKTIRQKPVHKLPRAKREA